MGPCSDVAASRGGHMSSSVTSLEARRAERVWRHIRAIRQCTFTTRTPYGEPHQRTMRLQNRSLAADEPLWFFIERGSDLLLDIAAHPEVQVEFTDRAGHRWQIDGCASPQGNAEHLAFSAPVRHWRLPTCPMEDAQHLMLLRVGITQVREIAPTEAANAAVMQRSLAFA